MTDKPAFKFALVLEKRGAPATLLAAVWQTAHRLVTDASAEQRQRMHFLDYRDGDGESHAPVSALPLAILRGKSGDIRKALAAAAGSGGAILSTAVPGDGPDGWTAALFFGPRDAVDAITRRFSLWTT